MVRSSPPPMGRTSCIIDAATLTEVRRLQGHSDVLQVIRFSPSGALLASGSDDRTAIVWDVTTGERQELLRGHSAGVWGVGFSPDEGTLYTTAGRTMLTWDLTGQRRFIARRPLADRAAQAWAQASPTGDAVAYLDGDVTRLTSSTSGPVEPDPSSRTAMASGAGSRGARTGAASPPAAMTGSSGSGTGPPDEAIIERHVAPIHISAIDYTGDGRRLVVVEQNRHDLRHRRRDAGTRRHTGPGRWADHQCVRQPGQPHRRRLHVRSLHTGRPRQRPGPPRRRCPLRVHRRVLA